LHGIGAEVEIILKQKIIKLVRLSVTKIIRDTGFSSSWISVKTGDLISIKSVFKSAKYISSLLISIITLMKF